MSKVEDSFLSMRKNSIFEVASRNPVRGNQNKNCIYLECSYKWKFIYNYSFTNDQIYRRLSLVEFSTCSKSTYFNIKKLPVCKILKFSFSISKNSRITIHKI